MPRRTSPPHHALKAWRNYLEPELPADAFSVSGRSFLFQSSDSTLRSLVKTHWGAFEVDASSLNKVHAVFKVSSDPNPPLPPLRRLHSFVNDHFVFLSDGKRYLLTGYLYHYPWQFHCAALPEWDSNFIYYYVVEPVLLDFLKKHGLLMWHSGAVMKDGAAVLLPGLSGSGKSTTTLNLLSLGYRFIADDLVLLNSQRKSIEASGHESDLYVTEQSLRLLPEWKKFKRGGRRKKGQQWKYRVNLEDFRPLKPSPAKVRFLLFPRVSGAQNTRLQSLTQEQAIVECLRQVPKEHPSSILGPSVLESLFEIYAKLVSSARSYRLHLGADQEQVRQVLSRLATNHD